MSGAFDSIERCLDLQEDHIVAAMEGRAETRDLLTRLATVSLPNSGSAKALLVYARLATTACDWLDGDLAVDLVEDGGQTAIEAGTELGGGLRERLFPPLKFDTPLDEFARAIARVPHLIAPLTARSSTARRIRLSALAMVRRTTAPPPPFAIASASLFIAAAPAVPKGTAVEAADEALSLPGVVVTPRRAAPKEPSAEEELLSLPGVVVTPRRAAPKAPPPDEELLALPGVVANPRRAPPPEPPAEEELLSLPDAVVSPRRTAPTPPPEEELLSLPGVVVSPRRPPHAEPPAEAPSPDDAGTSDVDEGWDS